MNKKANSFAAIILAAGKGTRMRSSMPKVLHPIGGKPMIAHVLDALKPLRPERIVTVIAPGMEEVKRTARAACPSVEFAEQKEQLGTGHAVKCAREVLGNYAGTVIVLYGDAPLISPEIILETLTASQKGLAVLGMRPDNAAEYGRMVTAKGGVLKKIVEFKDATAAEKKITLCNSGIMAAKASQLFPLLDKLTPKNAKKEYYLTDVVALASAKKIACIAIEGHAPELAGVNSRAQLAEAEAILQNRLRFRAMDQGATLIAPETIMLSADTQFAPDVTIHPYVVFGAGVKVEAGTEIRSFSHIEAAHIGRGCIIGPFARLRPGATLGDRVHIGNFVEIKKADVEDGAKINHLTYIGDARIGKNTNIGAGTITCNYDGFDKFFTEIGDNVFVGSNTSLLAPVKIGDGAVIGAGSVISQEVESEALALTRTPQLQKKGWAKGFRERKRAKVN